MAATGKAPASAQALTFCTGWPPAHASNSAAGRRLAGQVVEVVVVLSETTCGAEFSRLHFEPRDFRRHWPGRGHAGHLVRSWRPLARHRPAPGVDVSHRLATRSRQQQRSRPKAGQVVEVAPISRCLHWRRPQFFQPQTAPRGPVRCSKGRPLLRSFPATCATIQQRPNRGGTGLASG